MEIRFTQVEVYNYTNKDAFMQYVAQHRKPLLVRGLNIGPCTNKWTVDYLMETIKDIPISAHVSPADKMNFIKKNFTYIKMPFNEFVRRASGVDNDYKPILCEHEVLYYRSISFERRGKECSDIRKLFPEIADDFTVPDVFDPEDFFSSIFRIASPRCQVWIHYDVMDNILVQISGTKKVVLFSPEDADYLYMNGDKSEVTDIENPDLIKYPLFACALQHECIMEPGDAIFIPALWFHTARALEFSISVNVFWKNLRHDLYDKKDVYGNKDLIPANKAMAYTAKAMNELSQLPDDYRKFYLLKLIQFLRADLERTTEIPNAKPELDISKEPEADEDSAPSVLKYSTATDSKVSDISRNPGEVV